MHNFDPFEDDYEEITAAATYLESKGLYDNDDSYNKFYKELYDEFTKCLKKACSEIDKKYLSLRHVIENNDFGFNDRRERIYCYELYHQLRLSMLGSNYDFAYFTLQGEVDKSGHFYLRKHEGTNRKKPDFLLHVPGIMGRANAVIMEVKSLFIYNEPIRGPYYDSQDVAKIVREQEIPKDLKKLTAFTDTHQGQYFKGIYLVYGQNEDALETFKATCKKYTEHDYYKDKIDLNRIDLYWQPDPRTECQKMNW